MPIAPSANTTVTTSGPFSSGDDYIAVIGCVPTNADSTPRVFGSAAEIYAQHGYGDAVDYAAMHISETRKPVLFVGIPIVTAATAGSQDSSAWTGTSIPSISAASTGYLGETEGILTCTKAGTAGVAPGPEFSLCLDGFGSNSWTTKQVRFGSALTYTVPYLGIVISLTSGTAVVGDVYRFRTTAPMWDSAGLALARTNLAAQQKGVRTAMVIGELANSTFAGYVTTFANTYETSNKRFILARAQVKERHLARKSKIKKQFVAASAAETLQFAEVGATGDTITRTVGSFVTDGFAVGDVITVAGSASNNVTGKLAGVSATVLTFDTTDLANEGPTVASGVITIVGSEELLFAEVGATGDTITRSTGSWVADGFAVGDSVTITGSASNNVTTDAITALSATVMTLGSTDLAAESIAGHLVSIVKAQTYAAHVAVQDAAFSSVDAQKRIDLGYGRARKASPLTLWEFRRPSSWAFSLAEYTYPIQQPVYTYDRGPLKGWRMTDLSNTVVEYDERGIGGATAARFSCLTTLDNGPEGAFASLVLTRDTDGTVLSRTHNMVIADIACTTAQREATLMIGQTLTLKSTGEATEESLQVLEARVNDALRIALLLDQPAGLKRASSAVWVASRTDILTPGATLHATLDLLPLGVIEHVTTSVNVRMPGS